MQSRARRNVAATAAHCSEVQQCRVWDKTHAPQDRRLPLAKHSLIILTILRIPSRCHLSFDEFACVPEAPGLQQEIGGCFDIFDGERQLHSHRQVKAQSLHADIPSLTDCSRFPVFGVCIAQGNIQYLERTPVCVFVAFYSRRRVVISRIDGLRTRN